MREQDKVAHLLRRTSYGVRPEELKKAQHQGYGKTVQRLIQGLNQSQEPSEAPPLDVMPAIAFPVTILTFARGVMWWAKTMVETPSPLTERLTVFWHRHFATSGQKVFRPGWMFAQNLTFRREGRGPFADLLKAMVRDPAMLSWLDARNTPAEKPNENLGREMLELFTLGRGHYTEKDVKELAKLTAGKRLGAFGKALRKPQGTYQGPVSLLGRKGQEDLDHVLERLAVHPVTAKRMVRRLWDDFAASTLPAAEEKRLVKIWIQSKANITIVLRSILLSDYFFEGVRQRVLSPVELFVCCSRILGTSAIELDDLKEMDRAGELLFFPPSVKGWELGQALIHPAAFQSRLSLVERMVKRLDKNHFALRGLQRTPRPANYLAHITGQHVKPSTLQAHLSGLDPKESLTLALASPDMWTC